MERELILPVKGSNYDKKKMAIEIATMEKFLPYIESFKTFCLTNDVFEIGTHKLITKSRKIKAAYEQGMEKTNRYYVFSKN